MRSIAGELDTEVSRFVPDLRRRVALRAIGAARILQEVQSALEDVRGAIDAGQNEVAVLQARNALTICLSVVSLSRGGEVQRTADQLTFDPFVGLEDDEVDAVLRLIDEGLDLDDRAEALDWVERVSRSIEDVESLLDYEGVLPVLRSPGGLFPALRLARPWVDLVEELGLAPLLPPEWSGRQ